MGVSRKVLSKPRLGRGLTFNIIPIYYILPYTSSAVGRNSRNVDIRIPADTVDLECFLLAVTDKVIILVAGEAELDQGLADCITCGRDIVALKA